MSRTYKDVPEMVRIRNARKGKDKKAAARLRTSHKHHLQGERLYVRSYGYQSAYHHTHLTGEDLFAAQDRWRESVSDHYMFPGKMFIGSMYEVEYFDGTVKKLEGHIEDWVDFGPKLQHGKKVKRSSLLYEAYYLGYEPYDRVHVRRYVTDREISCEDHSNVPERFGTCVSHITDRRAWYYAEDRRGQVRSGMKDRLRNVTKACNYDILHGEWLAEGLER